MNKPPDSAPKSRTKTKRVSAAVLTSTAIVGRAHAAGSDQIRIALIGCGGRGCGAAINAINSKANVKLVAMADAFQSRIEAGLRSVQAAGGEKVDVPSDRQFVGLNAYRDAIDSGVDMVLLCTPPGFRPAQFEAAVQAGKHVFMEKPVAVDAPGVRRVLKVNRTAKEKGLVVAVGHHLRHETKHQEVIKRLQDGVIGDIRLMRAYFCSGGVWVRPRKDDETEMHYQIRNWYYFNWLSGDHIVEQHVHDLDVINWLKDGHPTLANGMGGRQVRKGPNYGEIFDHHGVEFDYADGSKLLSFSRHIPNCWNSFSEYAHGTKGHADIEGHGRSAIYVKGQEPMQWQRDRDGHQVEHDDLFAAMLAGEPYNEADYGATSTMTAIMGRMATYSGKVVTWDEAFNSQIDLGPEQLDFDAKAPLYPGPDGIYACAIPGVTRAT